tara:strand:+ start:333 stop:479 length:147 start_codon:yes stop_codon:yes gene_type:complete
MKIIIKDIDNESENTELEALDDRACFDESHPNSALRLEDADEAEGGAE